MPLVIYGLGDVHTHTFMNERNYKKPGVCWPVRVPGLKYIATHVHEYEDFSKVRM